MSATDLISTTLAKQPLAIHVVWTPCVPGGGLGLVLLGSMCWNRRYLVLVERLWDRGGDFVDAWNFGPDDKDVKPVAWLVAKLVVQRGECAGCEVDERRHPHGEHYLRVDSSKARARLASSPRWNLNTALGTIVHGTRLISKARICWGQIRAYNQTH